MTVTPASPPIKAIETEYAGCRFRSRLEARWAVFFDALGVPWQYEEQGYELPSGRYLPDFVIKASLLGVANEIYVEVKGSLGHDEFVRLIRAATELPVVGTGPMWPQLLVLGDIPRPGRSWTHARVEVGPEYFALTNVCWSHSEGPVVYPFGESVPYRLRWLDAMTDDQTGHLRDWLLRPCEEPRLVLDPMVDAAYRAARSARFEFGETPAPPEKETSTAERTRARVRAASTRKKRPSLHDRIATSADTSDLDTPEGRVAFLRAWAKEVGKLPVRSRERYVAQLVDVTGFDYREIDGAISWATGTF
jgi:hypothetical protein